MAKQKRIVHSVKKELIKKSKESALTAVQIFNNPLITFKSESFIVLMNIAWTYLLHAYYKDKRIDYRHYTMKAKNKRFAKTQYGGYKYWGLKECLDESLCSLETPVKENLKFLISIRNEIEHQMSNRIDDLLVEKFQACCINYNNAIKNFFGDDAGFDSTISVALQMFSFGEPQIDQLKNQLNLPKNILAFVSEYESSIQCKNDIRYSYKVKYTRDDVNHENQADIVYNFSDKDSEKDQQTKDILVRHQEKPKYLPSGIVRVVQSRGFTDFKIHKHTKLWQKNDAKNPALGYGVEIAKNWYWYKNWLEFVIKQCEAE